MAMQDAQQTRMVQREISRRYVDASAMEVCVINGVCYLRGRIRRLRTRPDVDLDRECDTIRKILRQREGIRAVIWEVDTIH
ncbi:MAG TPA: hypothetical protein VLH79_16375 [Chthonomonadales bacterium]|nr:hypothetical protein [Chthonomonadales bacterium]